MSHRRFAWEHLDDALLADLTAGVDLDDDPPATWLRANYGDRPVPEVVADHWPALRDGWLHRDDGARAQVVAALRTLGLGDASIEVAYPEGQRAYLASCRNQTSLRRIVTRALTEAGERDEPPLKSRLRPEQGWDEFVAALAHALASLQPGQYLICSVRGTGTEHEGAFQGSSYFVQFADGGERGVRAEAVANAFLAGSERLPDDQITELVGLGWQPPTYAPGDPRGALDEHGSCNFFREWDERPAPYADIAALACTSLQRIYGAAVPSFLEYTAGDADGNPLDLDELGIEVHGHDEAPGTDVEVDLPRPESPEELYEALAGTLRTVLTDEAVHRDEDGDVPIRWGSTAVYARVLHGAPVIRFFAPILRDLAPSPSLLAAVNEINRNYLMISAIWDGHALVLTVDVPGRPYVGSHVLQALQMLGTAADELDDQLQARFGGRTLFGEAAPAPAPVEQGSAGYL
ncbi:MAG TPA: YbjN domain-containing protein [Acidimicrobiales bacterium]|nr:YbjN domain-containing protein [Acidimicrobiales bacterium]